MAAAGNVNMLFTSTYLLYMIAYPAYCHGKAEALLLPNHTKETKYKNGD